MAEDATDDDAGPGVVVRRDERVEFAGNGTGWVSIHIFRTTAGWRYGEKTSSTGSSSCSFCVITVVVVDDIVEPISKRRGVGAHNREEPILNP